MDTDRLLRAALPSSFRQRFGIRRLASKLIEKIHLVFLDGAMVQAGLALLRLAGNGTQQTGDKFADQLRMLDEDAAGLLLRYADSDVLRHKLRRMLAVRAAWFASRAMILQPQALARIDAALADFVRQPGDAPHACFFAATARDILRLRH